METKPFWASKTLWINAVGLVAALLAAFYGASVGVDGQTAVVAGVMTIVNLILRLTTTSAVTIVEEPDA